ncbi:MAG: NUDIX domain-containing protein [archaeon]
MKKTTKSNDSGAKEEIKTHKVNESKTSAANINDEKTQLTEINKIFKTLMHFPASTFSDLWDKSIESNKFNYYLKKLETDGLIEKKNGKYSLTVKGKSASTTVSGETGKEEKRPAVTLLLVIRRKAKKANTHDYVLYKRFKEPYYGHCGFPGAKMKRGEEILESAERELMEETGLNGKGIGKIVCIQNGHVINDGELFHHMLQFVILFDDPKGELVKENREGTYEWATKDEILRQEDLFPDIPGVIEEVESGKFGVKEIKFLQKNQRFVGIESRHVHK